MLTQFETKQNTIPTTPVDIKENKDTVSKPDVKEKPNSTPFPFTRAVSLLRDEDKSRQDTTWQKALTDMAALAQERKLNKQLRLASRWCRTR
jgi:hypothetical protein